MADNFTLGRINRLNVAINEAERFIDRARAALDETGDHAGIGPTLHFAATKRASMDLTRALADVRRSPYG